MSDSDFDWKNAELIVAGQPPIAIVVAENGDIQLCGDRMMYYGEDEVITIPAEHAVTVARGILAAVGIDLLQPAISKMMMSRPDIDWKAVNEDFNEVEADVSDQKPKDPTAAERMRRYRNKHRNDRNAERNGDR